MRHFSVFSIVYFSVVFFGTGYYYVNFGKAILRKNAAKRGGIKKLFNQPK